MWKIYDYPVEVVVMVASVFGDVAPGGHVDDDAAAFDRRAEIGANAAYHSAATATAETP